MLLARASPAGLAHVATKGNDPEDRWYLYRHLDLVDQALVDVAAGRIKRLMIELPPRHGKSELTSKYLPAWYLGTHPSRKVLLASYEADFAAEWGRAARDVLEEWGPALYGVQVSPTSSAASRWDLWRRRGSMRTAGVGGPLTGKGGHLVIIDDPIKNDEEAYSGAKRDAMWKWYQFTLRTRLEPGAALILIMTRWHEDDLAGRLAKLEEDNPKADKWVRLTMPALAEPTEDAPDLIGRAAGEPLCPERYDLDELLAERESVGPLAWEALFQQRPTIPEGEMFKTHWWNYAEGIPYDVARWVRRWDLAATEKKPGQDPDWTAGVLMGRHADGRIFVRDARRIRGTPLEVERFIAATAAEDGRDVPVRMAQDPGQAGKSQVSHYSRLVLPQSVFSASTETGDKVVRAGPWASQVQAGNVFLLRGKWNAEYVEEHRTFPHGTHDDYVDSSSLAYDDLFEGSEDAGRYKHTGLRGRR